MAIEPEKGEILGLLWQKLWNREVKEKPPTNEPPEEKKERQKEQRKVARQKPFEEKESYKWAESLNTCEKQVERSTRVIHVFDSNTFAKLREFNCCRNIVNTTKRSKVGKNLG